MSSINILTNYPSIERQDQKNLEPLITKQELLAKTVRNPVGGLPQPFAPP